MAHSVDRSVGHGAIRVEDLDYGRALVFDRPEAGNTIDHAFLHDLDLALDAIERDPGNPIVILRGRDGVFCTGRDLSAPTERAEHIEPGPGAGDLFARYMDTLRRLATMPRIVIACVDGEVTAGGVGLVAASDLAVATPGSRFSLPELLWGLLPACVTPYLIRRVGFQSAYRMALTTLPVSAQRALDMSLVDDIAERPEQRIRQWALRLVRIQTASIRDLKRFYRDMWIIDQHTEAAAVAEIRRASAQPEVQARIRRFVQDGVLPQPPAAKKGSDT